MVTGPEGRLGRLPGSGMGWPDLAEALDWMPLPSLVLADDGTALAVSRAWSALSGLTVQESRGVGWIRAVEPPDRPALRARLRDAAAAGQAGRADVRLAGQPNGRWARWWWRAGPSGRLIVCAAGLGDCPDRDGQQERDVPPARLVRRAEFVSLAGRALRRARHQGGHVAVVAVRVSGPAGPASGTELPGTLLRAAAGRVSAAGPAGTAAQVAPGEFVILLDELRAPRDAGIIASQVRDALSQPIEVNGTPVEVMISTGVAVTDGHRRTAEQLIEEASSAIQPGKQPGDPGPPLPGPAAGLSGHDWPALAEMLVPRLLAAGLALQSAWSLADGPAAAQLQHALDQMDSIIQDTQAAVLASRVAWHRRDAGEQ